jgi:hypothetical protein
MAADTPITWPPDTHPSRIVCKEAAVASGRAASFGSSHADGDDGDGAGVAAAVPVGLKAVVLAGAMLAEAGVVDAGVPVSPAVHPENKTTTVRATRSRLVETLVPILGPSTGTRDGSVSPVARRGPGGRVWAACQSLPLAASIGDLM